jgi:hypothetical protein
MKHKKPLIWVVAIVLIAAASFISIKMITSSDRSALKEARQLVAAQYPSAKVISDGDVRFNNFFDNEQVNAYRFSVNLPGRETIPIAVSKNGGTLYGYNSILERWSGPLLMSIDRDKEAPDQPHWEITLEELHEFARQEEALSFNDFSEYWMIGIDSKDPQKEIWHFSIEGGYQLAITTGKDSKLEGILLRNLFKDKAGGIDIRYGDIDAYIAKYPPMTLEDQLNIEQIVAVSYPPDHDG